MQPLYQIPGDVFSAHVAKLRLCSRVEKSHPRLYALLFLSGLNLTFRCFKAELAEDQALPHLMPTHRLDDGLCDAAERGLSALVRRARSREMRETLQVIHGKMKSLPKWPAVKIAFIDLFDNCSWDVKDWLARGDAEINRERLACAMGIESL